MMTETAHTPGPWKIDDGEIQTEEGGLIGIVYSSDSFPCLDEDELDYDKIVAEYKANATLIAAAPDLLTALRGMVGAQTGAMQCHYEEPPELAAKCNCRSCAKKRALAALEKATRPLLHSNQALPQGGK